MGAVLAANTMSAPKDLRRSSSSTIATVRREPPALPAEIRPA
jgi:hypothetical protein